MTPLSNQAATQPVNPATNGTSASAQSLEMLLTHLPAMPRFMAMTGRVRAWYESLARARELMVADGATDPTSYIKRLPVSCTTFTVQDYMQGRDGIEDSWLYTSYGLRNAAGVALDLSNLSARDTTRPSGVVASGPLSFMSFYDMLNRQLRRGGIYKNGAITLYLDLTHPDVLDFITAPRQQFEWSKRAIYVGEELRTSPHRQAIVDAINAGDLWLAKRTYDKRGNRLYSNVCLEILLPHRGTCLLSHTNAGACPVDQLPQAMADNMSFLCQLHPLTGVDRDGHYLPAAEDKQVGLGWVGLANRLAIEGISYWELVQALEGVSNDPEQVRLQWTHRLSRGFNAAEKLAVAMVHGYNLAAEVAKAHGMERAFTIAPTATCAYNYQDELGYTCTPEVSPPLKATVERDSLVFDTQMYSHHPDVETATDVGYEVQWALMNELQRRMDNTELGHSISLNIWSDAVVDEAFLDRFLDSQLKTTYYRLQTNPWALDKSSTRTQALKAAVDTSTGSITCDCAE